jgi:hypothetical protein
VFVTYSGSGRGLARSGTIDPALTDKKVPICGSGKGTAHALITCHLAYHNFIAGFRVVRQQRRGYASGGIFTMAEADFTTTEFTRKQVPCVPGERSRRSHKGQGLPPICIRPAIRFIANTPPAMRAGVVSSVVVRDIPSKKAHFIRASPARPQHLTLAMVLARAVYS